MTVLYVGGGAGMRLPPPPPPLSLFSAWEGGGGAFRGKFHAPFAGIIPNLNQLLSLCDYASFPTPPHTHTYKTLRKGGGGGGGEPGQI